MNTLNVWRQKKYCHVGSQEIIPTGNPRTSANLRRMWLANLRFTPLHPLSITLRSLPPLSLPLPLSAVSDSIRVFAPRIPLSAAHLRSPMAHSAGYSPRPHSLSIAPPTPISKGSLCLCLCLWLKLIVWCHRFHSLLYLLLSQQDLPLWKLRHFVDLWS